MKAYLWSADGKPPPTTTRSRWWRFVEFHMPLVIIYLMVLTLIGVILAPHVLVTVPSGFVGVVWKRFKGGTVLDPRQLKFEGLRFIWPSMSGISIAISMSSPATNYTARPASACSMPSTSIWWRCGPTTAAAR